MKQYYLFLKIYLLMFVISFTTSCRGQSNSNKEKENDNVTNELLKKVDSQIGEYVGVFQDSKENLWFHTLQKGVAKYDGNKLVYFTTCLLYTSPSPRDA